MFSLFKKKSKAEVLQKQYLQILKEAQRLSLVDRMASYEKEAEADLLLKEIENLDATS